MSRTDKDAPMRIRERWRRARTRYVEGHPTRSEVHYSWYGPMRCLTHGQVRQAAAEYRATGQIDTVPDASHHRHSVGYHNR